MMQDFLHEYLDLTGSRMGCGQGICHACTVIVEKDDGSLDEMRTCITGAHWFEGKKVRTVEGHAKRDASGAITELSPVQQAFIEHFSFQCGYCTPGFVTGATVLIDQLKRTAGCRPISSRPSPTRSTSTSAAAPAMSATSRRCAISR